MCCLLHDPSGAHCDARNYVGERKRKYSGRREQVDEPLLCADIGALACINRMNY